MSRTAKLHPQTTDLAPPKQPLGSILSALAALPPLSFHKLKLRPAPCARNPPKASTRTNQRITRCPSSLLCRRPEQRRDSKRIVSYIFSPIPSRARRSGPKVLGPTKPNPRAHPPPSQVKPSKFDHQASKALHSSSPSPPPRPSSPTNQASTHALSFHLP